VQNSLDAKATRIEIGIDIAQSWECWIKDNGIGMSKADMQILAQGSMAGRYGKWQVDVNNRPLIFVPRLLKGL